MTQRIRAVGLLIVYLSLGAFSAPAEDNRKGSQNFGPASGTPVAADTAPAADTESAGEGDADVLRISSSAAAAAVALPVLPKSTISAPPPNGVDWVGLIRSSGRFLAVEQSFRLLTEAGTREGLKGPIIRNYFRAVSNVHGWSDGDEFYVNYVGHPMQGAVAGFLWSGNDRRYRHIEFGKDPLYWKARLRAAGFIWVYSTQFEIGAVSEASIGAIQAVPPQQGFVDHVITPSMGMAWMIAEDAIDKYIVKRIEASTTNRYVRMLARGGMNPARSFANVLQGSPPWRRDTRPGILAYRADRPFEKPQRPATPIEKPGVAPAEFFMTFQAERLSGGGAPLTCVGGGGAAAFRLAASWQVIADVGGCKILGLDRNVSGDSMAFMAGPRWVHSGNGPWSAHVQFTVGGQKMTEQQILPDRQKVVEQLAIQKNLPPPRPYQYSIQSETNGFAVAAGGGVHYKLNRALAIRVAEISYRRSWMGPLIGRDAYNDSVRVSSGLVLRMGTW
jgi:hypothetical protein